MKVTKLTGLLLVLIGVLATSLVLVMMERSSDLQQTTNAPNSIRVEGRGLRVTLNYSSLNLRLGDIFRYTTELANVDSPSRLSLLQSTGEVTVELRNETGVPVWQVTGVYARGPPGPQQESFIKGQKWGGSGYLDTSNLPNKQLAPNNRLAPGNYILSVRYKYYNLDLQTSEEIGLQTSLKISAR